jgi:chaperone BCS1
MDVHVEFKLASKHQARELFRRFYLPTKRKVSPTTTAALSSSEKPKDTSSEKQSIVTTNGHANGHSPEAPSSVTGQTHIFRAPELSDSEVTALADKFVQKVPERELSMAAIQGYLMVYKTRPVEASENVGEWVEKERADRAKKMKGKRSSKIEVVKEAAKAEE